jgi:hypothetical protein
MHNHGVFYSVDQTYRSSLVKVTYESAFNYYYSVILHLLGAGIA